MCGIAGIINFNGKKTQQVPYLHRMTNQMHRRGPDDEGFIIIDSTDSYVHTFFGDDTALGRDKIQNMLSYPKSHIRPEYGLKSDIALGHRRLSILDLSFAGHQPMCTEDGRYWIVYNGEIYNFREIRKELEDGGESFFSGTDTEVVLKSYRKWGSGCVTRFNGMWAFAIWDNKKKILFCSRDRIGIKPFYYYLTDAFFLFASDIKTLIASGLYTPEPEWEGVYHALSFQCAPRPMTCFKGVKALEQSFWMTLDLNGRMNKERYWHMPVGEINYSKNEDEWTRQLEHLLQQSVRRRLIADVPVATFMSGGIDSTTISAIASREHPGIKAFTLAYKKEAIEYDESAQARATARMCPMDHIIKEVDAKETLQYLDEMIMCLEEPYVSLHPNYVISQLVAEHDVKVVLSGLGGDELFCGYGRTKFLPLWKVIRPFHNLIGLLPDVNAKVSKGKLLASANDIYEFYLRGFSVFSEQEKQALFSPVSKTWNSCTAFRSLYGLDALQFCEPLEALCYIDIISYIGSNHVYRDDQLAMHFSIEERLPYLDHELVEFACRIPSRLKVRRLVGKYILRNVARKFIHPSCLTMPKKGFQLPVGRWMKSSLKDLVDEKIERLKQRGIMNPEAIDHVKNSFYKGRVDFTQLWVLVTVELWLERFIDTQQF